MASSAQRGVSLIELMIGITISLIIMAGVIVVFVNITTSSSTVLKSTQLNNELRSTLNLMVREIQKAGYVDAWDEGTESINTTALGDFGLIGPTAACNLYADPAVCDCILYSYDRPTPDDDGNLDGDSDMNGGAEEYGFKRVAAGGVGAISIKRSDATATPKNNCTTGTWEAVTSSDINITALTFQVDPDDNELYEVEGDNDACDTAGEICLDRRKINIEVNAQLTSDPDVTASMTVEVKLRNDRYFTES